MNQAARYLWLFPTLISAYAFAQPEDMPPPDQSLWQTLMMVAIAFLFFYVILWRPEQKRRQAVEAQRSALKKGDRVAAMGILGTVMRINDQTVILRMYDGAKLEFLKGAITEVLPAEETGKSTELREEEGDS